MANSIGSISSTTDYSSLFSNLSTSSTSDSTGNLLSDWASIKNGSYGKLTKAYYGKASVTQTDSDEAKATIKANTELKSDASDVKNTLASLSSAGLYEKTTTDADGNSKTGYDYDKIYSNLKSFVEKYNNIIDTADDSDNAGVLRNAASMTKITAVNQNVLSKIGITIGENNKLSISESAVKGANINDIKSLFQGGGSYGSQIEASSTELINKINAENNKLSSYTASGSYDYSASIGKIYDGTY